MTFEIVTITPELAQELLTMNMDNNRKLSKDRVRTFALDMQQNRWRMTHQCIAFDAAGRLIDGQHRLTAVARAGVPVQMAVAHYEPEDDNPLFAIDIGMTRTAKAQATINGESAVVIEMMPVAQAIMRSLGLNTQLLTAERKVRFIKDNLREFTDLWNALGESTTKIHATVEAALLLAIANYAPKEAITKFAEIWRSNDVRGTDEYNVKCVLGFKQRIQGVGYTATIENMKRAQGIVRAFITNTKTVTDRFWFPAYGRLNMGAVEETRDQ